MKKLTIVIFLVLTVFLTSSFKNVEASSYLFIGHIEHTEFVPYNTFFECMGDPNGDPSYLFPSPMSDSYSIDAMAVLKEHVNDATVMVGLLGMIFVDINCSRVEDFFDDWTYGEVSYYKEWISESTIAHRYKIQWFYGEYTNPSGVYKYYTVYDSVVHFPWSMED